MELYVDLGAHSYSIYIENNILKDTGSYIEKVYSGKKIMIISDDNVFPLYGDTIVKTLEDKYEVHSLILPHGEPTKSFQSLPKIYSALLEARFSRSDLIIALGGGVIGDLAGFAAASFLRGIKFIQIPTSLLAQVDSSVGGKVAVDLPEGKNLVGAFYQPALVLIDPLVLNTLPERYINDGMGEVIKYGCIRDRAFFDKLAAWGGREGVMEHIEEVIHTCCDIKRKVVLNDERDTGERMVLNFGHTIGHAFELAGHYETWTHGQGVAAGMCVAARLGEQMGITPAGTAETIQNIFKEYQLPLTIPCPWDTLVEAVGLDKKNAGSDIRLIVLEELGKAVPHAMPRKALLEALTPMWKGN